MLRLVLTVLLAGVFLFHAFGGICQAEPAGKLIIFHAGSLSMPLEAMAKAFNAKYPKVEIVREAGGSTTMARKIADEGKTADIMASADYVVIDKTLIPKFTSWNALFATNQIVLCYTDKSKFASEINKDNWYDILERKGVVWGHSDPNLDPAGYRSLMTLQLAGIFYKKPDLYQKLLANRPQENVKQKAGELISMLQAGTMDYAFEYLSVAVQHQLKYVALDDHINLSDYALDAFYKQAKVEVTGNKPGTTIERVGGSITYGITMLDNAPNKEAAEAFLKYLFDPDGGLAVLKSMGQPPLVPVRVPTEAMRKSMPASLQSAVSVQK